jgi:hypothetical protein
MAASFRALWRHADAPGVAAAAGWLFNDPDSPWAPLLKKTDRVSLWHLDALITSPLVGVPAFRKQLLAELANTNRVGTLRWKQGGQYDISLDAGGGGTTGVNHTNTPAPGTEIVLRHRDYIAHRLASLSAMPAFEYFWPEARRDEAAADCAAVLRQFGGRFRYRPRPEDPWTPSHFDETARMTFDALDHPATRDDVRTGRAIFSLEGEGTIRVCPLAPAPLAARWVALTNYPYDQQFLDSRTGKAGTRLAYVQEGEIWQAEELWRTDHWERFYGFAGAHHVARVPAADIEFPPPSGLWYPLSRKVDCMAAVAESSPRRAFAWPPRFVLGDPLWIELRLHNRAGHAPSGSHSRPRARAVLE